MTMPALQASRASVSARSFPPLPANCFPVTLLLPFRPATVGIYSDSYALAGAVDELGPQYGLPHAVSGSLAYYLWGPGYSWDVMIILSATSNPMSVFFDECDLKGPEQTHDGGYAYPSFYVCRKPKVSAERFWSNMKRYR